MDFAALSKTIASMVYNPIRHYIVPGLTSYLLGEGPNGKVRLFRSDRDQEYTILPHSHRFDFTCIVLGGKVTNILYEPMRKLQIRDEHRLNDYAEGTLVMPPGGGPGSCILTPGTKPASYARQARAYAQGDSYTMQSSQIHSIEFSRGAEVLFFEGPQVTDTSIILEPWSNGERVPTYGAADWMFIAGEG